MAAPQTIRRAAPLSAPLDWRQNRVIIERIKRPFDESHRPSLVATDRHDPGLPDDGVDGVIRWRAGSDGHGPRVIDDWDLAEIARYIDWSPFFQTWELRGKFPKIFDDPHVGAEARKLYGDAQQLLQLNLDGSHVHQGCVGCGVDEDVKVAVIRVLSVQDGAKHPRVAGAM